MARELDKCDYDTSSSSLSPAVHDYENVVLMLTQCDDVSIKSLVPKQDDEDIYEPIKASQSCHSGNDDGAECDANQATASGNDDRLDIQRQIEDEILKNFLCNDDDDALTSSKYAHEDDVVSREIKCEMQPQMSLHDVTTKDDCAVAAASSLETQNVGCDVVLPQSKLPCTTTLPSPSSPCYSSSFSSYASTSATPPPQPTFVASPTMNGESSSQKTSRKTVRKNFSLWIGVTSCVWGLLLLFVKNYVN